MALPAREAAWRSRASIAVDSAAGVLDGKLRSRRFGLRARASSSGISSIQGRQCKGVPQRSDCRLRSWNNRGRSRSASSRLRLTFNRPWRRRRWSAPASAGVSSKSPPLRPLTILPHPAFFIFPRARRIRPRLRPHPSPPPPPPRPPAKRGKRDVAGCASAMSTCRPTARASVSVAGR